MTYRPSSLGAKTISGNSRFFYSCLEAAQICWTEVDDVRMANVGIEEWRSLKSLSNLRRLSVEEGGLYLPPLVGPDSEIPQAMLSLHLQATYSIAFETIQLATARSLRDLGVPVHFVSVLRATQFPELYQLTLYGLGLSKAAASDNFLDDFSRSTSVKVFELAE